MKMSFFRKRKLKKEVEKAMLPPKKEDGKISQKSKVSVPEKQEKTRSSQDSAKINTRNVKEKKERKILPKKKFSILLERAGLSISLDKLSEIIFKSAVVINILISIYLIYFFSVNSGYSLAYVIVIMINLWLLGFIVLIISLWLMFYLFLDLKIYQRNISIVEVFPDFLQLTSANIRAGMAIDQALWHAIRPNFGVLAKEMEDVAKKTMTGMSLEEALYDFASKYESPTIKRSISLLIEGLNAGGEIGELLDRISNNIQESKTMQKEMAASVTTYAIFISFASIAAAPFLLALSSQLLIVIESIISTINVPASSGSAMAISFSQVGVKPSDFRIFAMVTLAITSTLSACIVATIKKGNIKAGIRYIPMFVFSSVILFLILNKVLGAFISQMF